MNAFPSSPSNVPSIHIFDADDSCGLFHDTYLEDIYSCSQDLNSDYPPSITTVNHIAELEDIAELAHLTTTSQPFLTGHSFSIPDIILQETTPEHGLSLSLASPIPSPTLSINSSLSPSSFYDSFGLSDSESLLSPSPDTPDLPWPPHSLNHQSSESLVSILNDSFVIPVVSSTGPLRPRAKSSPPRPGPVASKAMLEANSRRRRHPAQFTCPECQQTFTALFSLKRHQQSHTGERPFVCGVPGCSQRFFNSSDCKRHEKSTKRHKDLLFQ